MRVKIEFKSKTFCITGALETYNAKTEKLLTRQQQTELIKAKGGVVKSSVTRGFDYLVVGGKGSKQYSSGSKGDKSLKAEQQENTSIITEKELLDELGYEG